MKQSASSETKKVHSFKEFPAFCGRRKFILYWCILITKFYDGNMKAQHCCQHSRLISVIPSTKYAAEWVAFMLLIREVRVRILSGDKLPLLKFSWFSSVPLSKCRDSTLKPTFFHSLSNSLLISHLKPGGNYMYHLQQETITLYSGHRVYQYLWFWHDS